MTFNSLAFLRKTALVAAVFAVFALCNLSVAQADPLAPLPVTPRVVLKGPTADDQLHPTTAFALTDETISVIFETAELAPAEIRTFDRATGTLLSRAPVPAGIDTINHAVTDGEHLVLLIYTTIDGYTHTAVEVLDAATMTPQYRLMAPSGENRLSFGWSLEIAGGRLAISSVPAGSAERSGRLYVYDLATGEELYHIQDPELPSGLFSFLQSEDHFPGPIAMTETQIAVSAGPFGEGMQRVHLFDAKTGAHMGQLEKPQLALGSASFGEALALDDERIYVAAERATNVRILLDATARTGQVFAIGLDDQAVDFVLDDPIPVSAGTPNAALAAAMGQGVPYYGAGFGRGLMRSGDKLFVGMYNYPLPVRQAGAVAVYDATDGTPLGLIQSAEPRPRSNFLAVWVSGDSMVGYSNIYDARDRPTTLEFLTFD